jgi:hypothetical protein
VASKSSMLTGAHSGGGGGLACGTHIIIYCNRIVKYYLSYVEGKYNKKGFTIVFTKVTSISIHHLSSYKIYKSCRVTMVQVVEHNPPIKNKRSTRTLFSHYGLHAMVTSHQATC